MQSMKRTNLTVIYVHLLTLKVTYSSKHVWLWQSGNKYYGIDQRSKTEKPNTVFFTTVVAAYTHASSPFCVLHQEMSTYNLMKARRKSKEECTT